MSDVLLCHGKEGSPNGAKANALRQAGVRLSAPDFQGQPYYERLQTLASAVDEPPVVAVGSSMGGALLLQALHDRVIPSPSRLLLLLAPAVMLVDEEAWQAPDARTVVIQGLHDAIVSPDLVRRWHAAIGGDAAATIHYVDDGHRLSEPSSRALMISLVQGALSGK